MLKLKRLDTCLLLAFGSVCFNTLLPGGPALAQTPQRIEVTGSNIKRLTAEGPVPVEVITRAEIEQKGVQSTHELLRSLSYMSSHNDELLSNSPNTTGAAGAGAGFRGLLGDQTVVLLNGRRLASYGFDGAFVNLNTIPLGAIQRVEVLKDGAAAIYGADAIGGVINFITRKDYRGAEVAAGHGVSGQGDSRETTLAGTVGLGHLETQGYNLLLNLNHFKRDPLTNLQRERTRTANFSRFGGGNQLSTFAPSGNFVNPNTGLQSPFTPCPDPTLLVSPSPLTPGAAGSASCLFDFAPYRTTVYGTERLGGIATGRLQLGRAQVFGELMFARSESTASAAPAPGEFELPSGHPANPFGSAIRVLGRPLQAGPRVTDNRADASRVLLGVEGQFAGQEINLAVGQARNKVVNVDSGYFLNDRMRSAIADRSLNPFALNNPQSVIDAISSSDRRTGETTHGFADARLSGELFALRGGPVGYAAGVTLAREEIEDVPGANARAGNIFGGIQQSQVVADRKLAAAYVELSAPLARTVEAQLALRHDRYSGQSSSSSTTPKLALRWQPMREFMLRGSYAEGFKMPSLRNLFGGLDQSADSVQDFPGCAARNVAARDCPRLQYFRFSSGNAQLRPEQSKSWNFGLAFEPTRELSLGLDHFIIEKTDEIGLVLAQFVVDNVPYAPGATTTLGGNPLYSVTRNAGGTIQSLNTSQGNLGQRKIRGLDLSATQRLDTALGRLTLEGNGTYYTRYDYADQPGTPLYGRLRLLNLPRWKSQAQASLATGGWTLGLSGNFRGRMWDKQQATAATPVQPSTRLIGNFDTFDASVGYSGIAGLRLSVGVKNLFDKEPPFSSNDARTLGFAQVDEIRGRFFWLNANYTF